MTGETNRAESTDPAAGGPTASGEGATERLTEEDVLNAAVAFAGHVVTAAQQAAAQQVESSDRQLSAAVLRQYLLETATLCLRRLGESYAENAGEPGTEELSDLLRDGAEQSASTRTAAEAIGDLGLDLLDRLLGE